MAAASLSNCGRSSSGTVASRSSRVDSSMAAPFGAPASWRTRSLVSLSPASSQRNGPSGASVSLGNSSPWLAFARASTAGFFFAMTFPLSVPFLPAPRPGHPYLHLVEVVEQGLAHLPLHLGEEVQSGQLLHLPRCDAVLGPVEVHGLVVGHDDRDHPRVLARLGALARQHQHHLPDLARH